MILPYNGMNTSLEYKGTLNLINKSDETASGKCDHSFWIKGGNLRIKITLIVYSVIINTSKVISKINNNNNKIKIDENVKYKNERASIDLQRILVPNNNICTIFSSRKLCAVFSLVLSHFGIDTQPLTEAGIHNITN